MSELADAILRMSQNLGIDPVDVATAVSYETGGTFDPWQAGPTTKWGQHRGLIQWGVPQRQRYGVYQGMPVAAQVDAIGRYLTDAGVRPGMGLLDVYSAINAGRVGRYNASDTAAGGAPGTVRDKVERQMAAHRAKAQQLLGGRAPPAVSAVPASIAEAFGAPVQPPASFGQILASTLGSRPQSDPTADADAEKARRAALFGNLGAFFG